MWMNNNKHIYVSYTHIIYGYKEINLVISHTYREYLKIFSCFNEMCVMFIFSCIFTYKIYKIMNIQHTHIWHLFWQTRIHQLRVVLIREKGIFEMNEHNNNNYLLLFYYTQWINIEEIRYDASLFDKFLFKYTYLYLYLIMCVCVWMNKRQSLIYFHNKSLC